MVMGRKGGRKVHSTTTFSTVDMWFMWSSSDATILLNRGPINGLRGTAVGDIVLCS